MLRDADDAFGHLLFDELHGRTAYEIVERDDGYAQALPASTYFRRFEEWHPHTQSAMDFVRGRVLDVGVGAARHALHLQSKGHAVVGIDHSPLAIEVARQRGLDDGRGCPVTQVGRHLGLFDTILLLGSNFGLLEGSRRSAWLLRRFATITKPHARIVAQTRDPYDTDETAHLAYHDRNRRRGRLPGQVRIRIRYQDRRTPYFDYLLVSPEEMEDLLRGTGWRLEEVMTEPGLGTWTALIEKR